MTVKINTLKPTPLSTHETDFGTSIAQSLWEKVADGQNWLNLTVPIGYLMFFNASQTYANGTSIPKPNPELWFLCNGDQIIDPDSPLNGVLVPDLRNLFLKGGNTLGLTGGALTTNLAHTHGGITVPENDESGRSNADQGGDHVAGSLHHHTIFSQWSSAEPIVPPFRELQVYMRYK